MANDNPEVRNAHHIKSLEVTEFSDALIKARAEITYRQTTRGVVTVAAELDYDVEFIREGDRFRIRKLNARIAGQAPAPEVNWSPDLVMSENLVKAVEAERALSSTVFGDTSIRNQVEAFAGYWYWFFDVRPEGALIADSIAEDAAFTMTRPFANRAEFLEWYAQMRRTPMLNR